jgi:universal stress protein F
MPQMRQADIDKGRTNQGHFKMYNKIIVAIDLSQIEKGQAIIKRAETLVATDGEIILVNVVEELPNYLAIDVPVDLLQRSQDEALDQLNVLLKASPRANRAVLRNGPSAREILAYSEEIGADLIIVASHRPDITNYFIGATADRVVRHSNCSVLIERN